MLQPPLAPAARECNLELDRASQRDTIMSNLAEKGAANDGKTDQYAFVFTTWKLRSWNAASSVNSIRMAMVLSHRVKYCRRMTLITVVLWRMMNLRAWQNSCQRKQVITTSC